MGFDKRLFLSSRYMWYKLRQKLRRCVALEERCLYQVAPIANQWAFGTLFPGKNSYLGVIFALNLEDFCSRFLV